MNLNKFLSELDRHKQENLQYQSIVEILMAKLTKVKSELSQKEIILNNQSNLIKDYQVKYKDTYCFNKITKGILNSSKTAKKIGNELINELNSRQTK